MTSSSTARLVAHADARLSELLHLADALPDFAVSAAFGHGLDGGGATVTDVLAQLVAEQDVLAADTTAAVKTPAGDSADVSPYATLSYEELRTLIEDHHRSLCDAAVGGDEGACAAVETLSRRYEWAQSVLGQCAL